MACRCWIFRCKENHIFFFQTFWKDGLSKKNALKYDHSCIIGKYDISFSRKYDLTLWTENERWSFSKNTWKYNIFFRCSEKMVFSKRPSSNMIFLVLSGKMVFFFPKTWFFSLNEKWKMVFLEKYMEMWHPLYMRVAATNGIPRPSAKKESNMTFSRKNTPKSGWDSRLAF